MGQNYRVALALLFADFVNGKSKWIDGWKVKNWFDWCFAVSSFIVFLVLEGAIIYSYFTLLNLIR